MHVLCLCSPLLTGPQITFTAIHYVHWNKTFIPSHVLFLGKYLFLQAPDIFLTISTSLRGPGLPAQKMSPAGLGGIVSPWTATLLGQAQALQPLMAAHNTAWLSKFNCNIFGVSCKPFLCCCDRNLAASVRRSTLCFAEVQRIFFFNLMSFWSARGFYFRNRTNGNAAPLSCNIYCPVARAHWDWLLFHSGEAVAQRGRLLFNGQQEAGCSDSSSSLPAWPSCLLTPVNLTQQLSVQSVKMSILWFTPCRWSSGAPFQQPFALNAKTSTHLEMKQSPEGRGECKNAANSVFELYSWSPAHFCYWHLQ